MAYLDETGLARVWSKIKTQVNSLTNTALSVKNPITVAELKSILATYPGQHYPADGTIVLGKITSPTNGKTYDYNWIVVGTGYRQTSAGNKWGATLFAYNGFYAGFKNTDSNSCSPREGHYDRTTNNSEYLYESTDAETVRTVSNTVGFWDNSYGRAYLNGVFLNALSSDVKNSVQSVANTVQKSTTWTGSYSRRWTANNVKGTTYDKIYLPSADEVIIEEIGRGYSSGEGLGTQWPIVLKQQVILNATVANWEETSQSSGHVQQRYLSATPFYPLRDVNNVLTESNYGYGPTYYRSRFGTTPYVVEQSNYTAVYIIHETSTSNYPYYYSTGSVPGCYRPVCFIAN